MITTEIRNKIQNIKIYTKRIVQNSLSGDYLSAFKGCGLEFEQIRDYQFGDDIRYIDWNSSAKMNKTMVKQFVEERDRTVIIGVDISGSAKCSSSGDLRSESIEQVAAALAFIAHENKDNVGMFFFANDIEKWIPPHKGSSHVSKAVETLFTITPTKKVTNLENALKFLISLKKRNAVVFMISDWIDDASAYTKLLKVVAVEYDFVSIRVLDQLEKTFPDVGLLEVEDPETGQVGFLDTRTLFAHKLSKELDERLIIQNRLFKKNKIDLLDLPIGTSFVVPLVKFFKERIRRQI